jgi:hypothetical protein
LYRIAGKQYFFGECWLAADAALLLDNCVWKVLGIKVNFNTKSEYMKSRAKESNERRVEVSRDDISEYITKKVNDFTSKVNNKVARKEKGCKFNDESKENSPASKREDSSGNLNFESPNTNAVPGSSVPRNLSPERLKLISLSSDQTKSLDFPIGTPVWFQLDDENDGETYNEGEIAAVYLDLTSRDLVYEVTPKVQTTSIIRLTEKDLAFAPQCPLLVSPHLGRYEYMTVQDLLDEGEKLLEGKALFCEKVKGAWFYTVAVSRETGLKVYKNIPSSNVTCRNVQAA